MAKVLNSSFMRALTPTQRFKSSLCKPFENNAYAIITRAMPNDYNELLDVMWQCYFPEEPCTRSMGLGGNRNSAQDEITLKNLQQGFSLVSRCRESGKIVGGCVNTITSPWDSYMTELLACNFACPKMRELYMFWAHLQRRPDLYKRFCTGKVFELANLFVMKEARGRGVALDLARSAVNFANDAGFSLVRVDATSVYSQRICEKMYMRMVHELPYDMYIGKNREQVIKPDPPHVSVKTYVLAGARNNVPIIKCKH